MLLYHSTPTLTIFVDSVGVCTPVQQESDGSLVRAAARMVQSSHAGIPERFDVRPFVQQVGGHVLVPAPKVWVVLFSGFRRDIVVTVRISYAVSVVVGGRGIQVRAWDECCVSWMDGYDTKTGMHPRKRTADRFSAQVCGRSPLHHFFPAYPPTAAVAVVMICFQYAPTPPCPVRFHEVSGRFATQV